MQVFAFVGFETSVTAIRDETRGFFDDGGFGVWWLFLMFLKKLQLIIRDEDTVAFMPLLNVSWRGSTTSCLQPWRIGIAVDMLALACLKSVVLPSPVSWQDSHN
nr:hypothetical protein [Tanacetum cinerariifolium]